MEDNILKESLDTQKATNDRMVDAFITLAKARKVLRETLKKMQEKYKEPVDKII